MTVTTDLYQTLEVARDATPDEIKAAFKAKAKLLHPDKGGDAQLFTALNEAFKVLIDPDRRAHYDATGSSAKLSEFEDEVRSCLATAIQQTVEEFCKQPWPMDIPPGDFHVALRVKLATMGQKFDNDITQCKRRIRVLERALSKSKRKNADKASIVETLMQGMIPNLEVVQERAEGARKVVDAATEKLGELRSEDLQLRIGEGLSRIGFFQH